MSSSVLPIFSSKSFIVSGLTFRPLIHFEFIFVYGVRKCSNFILLHVAVQFSQHHLLKRLSLPPLYILASCVKNKVPKDKNGLDLTEAEDIKKKWQEYTEELYKKDLHDPLIMVMLSLIQSQTSWNVKSSGPQKASLRTKLVEVMEFQLSCFKSWKMML